MASASTPSANEPATDLILVQAKTNDRSAQITGRIVSSGISDVAFASVVPTLHRECYHTL